MDLFVILSGTRRTLSWRDMVRSSTEWSEGVLSLNERRSVIAKEHQRSQESKDDSNGLPRYKYQHESTSGGLRTTCDSLPFYRQMFLQGALQMRPPFDLSASFLHKTNVLDD